MSGLQDVVIVGGGLAGWSTAYYLKKSRPEINVLVVDHSRTPNAASSRSGGTMAIGCPGHPMAGNHDWQFHRLKVQSFLLHRQLAQEINGPERYGYRPIEVFSADASTPARQGHKWPIGRTIPTDDSKKGYAVQVDPPRFLDTLQRECDKLGVIYNQCIVHNVLWRDGQLDEVVFSNGHQVRRRGKLAVILCNGPWASQCQDWFSPKSRSFFDKLELQPQRWTSYRLTTTRPLSAKAFYLSGYQHRNKTALKAIGDTEVEIYLRTTDLYVTATSGPFAHDLAPNEFSRDCSIELPHPPPNSAMLVDAVLEASLAVDSKTSSV